MHKSAFADFFKNNTVNTVELNTKHIVIMTFPFCFPGVSKLEEGCVTLGMVTNNQPQVGLWVKLPFGATGTVAVTDLADAYKPNPLEAYSKGQLLRSVHSGGSFCYKHLQKSD